MGGPCTIDDVGAEESSPWPLLKLRRSLTKSNDLAPKGHAVILTTGAMNPVHLGHVQLLHQARLRLERAGYAVVGMWLSPSHDAYLRSKTVSSGTIGLSAEFRLEVARQAVLDDVLVSVGAWEASKSGSWPDYPEVVVALEDELDEWRSSAGDAAAQLTVFYACGTDHASKCGLYSGMGEGRGVVVVPRLGEFAEQEKPERLVFVAKRGPRELASLSSTKMRIAIAAKHHEYVQRSMSCKVAELVLQPNAQQYARFASDFEKLGVTPRVLDPVAGVPLPSASSGVSGASAPKRARIDDGLSIAPSSGCTVVSPPTALVAPSKISCSEGKFMLSTSRNTVAKGYYQFDEATRRLSEKYGGLVGTFLDGQIAPAPFAEDALRDPWKASPVHIKCVRITNSEIIAEMQSPSNAGAFFVLPSQLNGAEYPSDHTIVTHLDQYKMDRTGGPRGQLAVHPAAGQFVLHNAACDTRPDGINAVDVLLDTIKCSKTPYDIHLQNGYLALPDCPAALQPEVVRGLRKSLHLMRCLGMDNVTACGLDPTLKAASSASHKVTLIYASAVPVQAYLNYGKQDQAFQEEVSRLVITGQYYGALRLAALRAIVSSPTRIFLMPLGGGVFNNKSKTIAGAISTAIDMLSSEGFDVAKILDIRILTFEGKPTESKDMASLMHQLGKS